MTAGTAAPLGRPRGIFFVIVLSIVTLGIYHLYWAYSVFDDLKRHTGDGIGGGIGLVLAIFVNIANAFILPSEIGKMYVRDGRAAPMTGWTGLWVLLPLVGWFVWIVKVQGAMNRYWQSKGAA
jgi:Domain of unknown function (DUF4234)